MASLALGIAGAVIGGAIGGPLGASIGWSIGSYLGNVIDPQKVQGPRLNDLKLDSSAYGTMQPILFGTARIAGAVIWQTDLREESHTSGGKGGGGPEVTTYTYSASWAVRWCEGPNVQLLRLWADGRLVWAWDGSAAVISFTHYDGSETQLADPTMEAELGAGNVPGYRGLSYTVFTDIALDQFGNRLPNLTAELQRGPIDTGIYEVKFRRDLPVKFGGTDPAYFHSDYPRIRRWPMSGTDPIVIDVFAGIFFGGAKGHFGSMTLDRSTLDVITATLDATPPSFDYTVQDTGNQALGDYDTIYTAPEYLYCYIGSYLGLPLYVGYRMLTNEVLPLADRPAMALSRPYWDTTPGVDYVTAGRADFGLPDGLLITGAAISQDGRSLLLTTSSTPSCYPFSLPQSPKLPIWSGDTDAWYLIRDGVIADSGTVDAGFVPGGYGNTGGGARAAWSLENNCRWLWAIPTTDFIVRIYHIGDDKVLRLDPDVSAATTAAWGSTYSQHQVRGSYPWGVAEERVGIPDSPADATPTGPWAVPGDTTGILAISIYCTEAEGYCGTVAGEYISLLRRRSISGELTYADIVSELSVRDEVGLSADQIDVTEIEDPVTGYVVGNQATVRSCIEPLAVADFFGAVESDARIKFIKRGGASVATIATTDLGAHADSEESPGRVARTRMQEIDLPAKVDVNYTDEDADYQNGNQNDIRQAGRARTVTTLDLAIVMNAQTARRIAQAQLYSAWYGRDSGEIRLPAKYAYLEPCDVITLAEDGKEYRVEERAAAVGGVYRFKLRAELAALWYQVPVGASGSGIVTVTSPAPQSTDLLLLDIPYITDPAKQQIYWAAMAGADRPTWAGAALFKSIDSGVTYEQIASDNAAPDTFGESSDALGDFAGGNIFDEINSVTVVITAGGGALESRTRDAILNGANEFLLGDEIIQARDCVLTASSTYQLSGLLRGRRGTEWAMGSHVAGDRFVVLPAATRIDAAFGEYGALRQYKAVTFGNVLATAVAQEFTNSGRALKPYAPVQLGGGRNGAGDLTVNWRRRARVNNIWLDAIDVALDEVNERYNVYFYDDGTYANVLWTVNGVAAATTDIDATTQTLIWGSPQATVYWGVAQLGVLGPGYEARGAT